MVIVDWRFDSGGVQTPIDLHNCACIAVVVFLVNWPAFPWDGQNHDVYWSALRERPLTMPRGIRTAAQSQKAGPAYLKSERIPPFGCAVYGSWEAECLCVPRHTHGSPFQPIWCRPQNSIKGNARVVMYFVCVQRQTRSQWRVDLGLVITALNVILRYRDSYRTPRLEDSPLTHTWIDDTAERVYRTPLSFNAISTGTVFRR